MRIKNPTNIDVLDLNIMGRIFNILAGETVEVEDMFTDPLLRTATFLREVKEEVKPVKAEATKPQKKVVAKEEKRPKKK